MWYKWNIHCAKNSSRFTGWKCTQTNLSIIDLFCFYTFFFFYVFFARFHLFQIITSCAHICGEKFIFRYCIFGHPSCMLQFIYKHIPFASSSTSTSSSYLKIYIIIFFVLFCFWICKICALYAPQKFLSHKFILHMLYLLSV